MLSTTFFALALMVLQFAPATRANDSGFKLKFTVNTGGMQVISVNMNDHYNPSTRMVDGRWKDNVMNQRPIGIGEEYELTEDDLGGIMWNGDQAQSVVRVVMFTGNGNNIGGFKGKIEYGGKSYTTSLETRQWELRYSIGNDKEGKPYQRNWWVEPNGDGFMWKGGNSLPRYRYISFWFIFDDIKLGGADQDVVVYPGAPVDPVAPLAPLAPAADAAASSAITTSMYYLMMLTCLLLVANVALITYSRLCDRAPKYSKVDLYASSDQEQV